VRSYFADILTSVWMLQDLRISCSDYYHSTAMNASQWRTDGASRATTIDMTEARSTSPHVLLRHTSPSPCKESSKAMNKTTTNDRLEFFHIPSRTSVWRRGWKVPLGIVGFYVLGKLRLSSAPTASLISPLSSFAFRGNASFCIPMSRLTVYQS
jgi:hypothetical protein